MTQSTIAQFLYVVDVVDPFLHVSVLGGIFLVLLEAGVLLGDVLGTRDRLDD